MDDFSYFERLRAEGVDPLEAYKAAAERGVDVFGRFRMLRAVYGLSLVDAKRVGHASFGLPSLEDAQEALAAQLSAQIVGYVDADGEHAIDPIPLDLSQPAAALSQLDAIVTVGSPAVR